MKTSIVRHVVVFALLLVGELRAVFPQFDAAGVQVGTVQSAPGGNVGITEASGLVVSADHPGVLWVNNDGGTYPSQRLHAISKAGAVLGLYTVSNGAGTNWEGMTRGTGPNPAKDYLYFMNVGSGTMTMYRVEEPVANVGQAFVTASITADVFLLQFPSGLAPDCETIMNDPLTGDIYFVTKRPSSTTCGVYRFPKANQIANSPTRYTLQTIKDDITLPAINGDNRSRAVTDGTIAPDGREILIRTNGPNQRAYLWQWNRAAGQTMAAALSAAWAVVPMHSQPQGETVAYEPDGSGYYTISEGGTQPIWYHARILPAPLTFAPAKDTMCREFAPNTNDGTSTQMQCSGQSGFRKNMYLQFNVSGIPAGAVVKSATLLITSKTTATGRTITAHAVASTTWGETSVTWNTKPALGASLSSRTSYTLDQDATWNVTSHLTGNGNFTVGLDSTYNAGDTGFYSRESGAANAPALVITYQP